MPDVRVVDAVGALGDLEAEFADLFVVEAQLLLDRLVAGPQKLELVPVGLVLDQQGLDLVVVAGGCWGRGRAEGWQGVGLLD
jgi:hypothetical protein